MNVMAKPSTIAVLCLLFTLSLAKPMATFAGRTCCSLGSPEGDATTPSCTTCWDDKYTKSKAGGYSEEQLDACRKDTASCIVCGEGNYEDKPAASDCDSGGGQWGVTSPLKCTLTPSPTKMFLTVGESMSLAPNLKRTPGDVAHYNANLSYTPTIKNIVIPTPAKTKGDRTTANSTMQTAVKGAAVGETSITLSANIDPFGIDEDRGYKDAYCKNSTQSILVSQPQACIPGAYCQTIDEKPFKTGSTFYCTMPPVPSQIVDDIKHSTGQTNLSIIYSQACDQIAKDTSKNVANYDQTLTSTNTDKIQFKNFTMKGSVSYQYSLQCSFRYCITGPGIKLCSPWGSPTN